MANRLVEYDPRRAAGSAALKPAFVLKRWADIGYDPSAENWLVHGLLPAEGLASIYGKPKNFKSFIALDLGVAVARGSHWAGRRVKQGPVVYIVGEGRLGMHKRIEAYKQECAGCEGDLPFYVIEARPNLGTAPGDKAELAEAIRGRLGDVPPGLIEIDTLARMLGDADENNEGMRTFANNAEELAVTFGCLVIAVHHEGANETKRMRGHTSLSGAVVSSWRVVKTSASGAYGCEVMAESKDAEDCKLLVTLRRVDVFADADGKRETTLLIDSIAPSETDDEPTPQAAKPKISTLSALVRAFDIARDTHGRPEQPHGPDGPRLRVVSKEQLRAVYYARRTEDTPAAKQKAFTRHLGAAINSEILFAKEMPNGDTVLWKA